MSDLLVSAPAPSATHAVSADVSPISLLPFQLGGIHGLPSRGFPRNKEEVVSILACRVEFSASVYEGWAVVVPHGVTPFVAVHAEAGVFEICRTLSVAVRLTASSASVVQPLAVLSEVRGSFIVTMAVSLTFGTSLRFLPHPMCTYLLTCNVKAISDCIVCRLC